MLQSWQLWASLLGQNSIPNCIFSSTTMLCKQLRCLHRSEQMHSRTPTAACDQLARSSPRAVSSRTSEDWQHGTGTGSSSVSPLHLRGLLGDTPFPSPACPFPASLQGGRGCGGNGGAVISRRDSGSCQWVQTQLKCRVCTLISALLPLAPSENEQQRGSQPCPYYSGASALAVVLFLGLVPVFPSPSSCYPAPVVT